MPGLLTVPVVERVDGTLPGEIGLLCDEAKSEGYNFITTLIDHWMSGENRFSKPGERLLTVRWHGTLAAVGGLTIETAVENALRVRRVYVRAPMRGKEIGRLLATALLDHARTVAAFATLRAGTPEAARFWEYVGFLPVDGNGYTHILKLG